MNTSGLTATAVSGPTLPMAERRMADLLADLRNIRDRVAVVNESLNGSHPKVENDSAKAPEYGGSVGKLAQGFSLAFSLVNAIKSELLTIENAVLASEVAG